MILSFLQICTLISYINWTVYTFPNITVIFVIVLDKYFSKAGHESEWDQCFVNNLLKNLDNKGKLFSVFRLICRFLNFLSNLTLRDVGFVRFTYLYNDHNTYSYYEIIFTTRTTELKHATFTFIAQTENLKEQKK